MMGSSWARLGDAVRLAGNPVWSFPFPDSHPGPKGLNPDPVAPRPLHRIPLLAHLHGQGWGGCLPGAKPLAFGTSFGIWEGKKEGRSDPQGWLRAQVHGSHRLCVLVLGGGVLLRALGHQCGEALWDLSIKSQL